MRWARLRELEAWAGRGRRRRRGQRIWRSFQHRRHRHSRGNWGAGGEQPGRGRDRAACQLGRPGRGSPGRLERSAALKWRSPNSMQRASRSPQMQQRMQLQLFPLLLLRRRQHSVVCLIKERKKAIPWTGKLLLVGPQPKSRFSLLRRTKNRTLVRPELIRSKDGMIDGDGGSAGNCRKCWASVGTGRVPSLGPRLIDPTMSVPCRRPFWVKRREACDDNEQ